MIQKQKWLKPARLVLSVLFLVGFIMAFSDVKAKLPSRLSDILTTFQFLPSVLKFITMPQVLTGGFIIILLITLLSGRFYCSTFCPLGVLQDIIGFVNRKLPFKKIRQRYNKPLNILRYSILAILFISLFVSGIFALNIFDPYANFGRIASDIYQPVFILANNLLSKLLMLMGVYAIQPVGQKVFHVLPFSFALFIFLLLIIMVGYRGRLYCNSICPVGTVLGLISKISFFKIRIDSASCTKCGKCQVACKANCIDIKQLTIDESRCIDCYNCIDVCEGSSIKYVRSIAKRPEAVTVKSKRDFLRSGLFFLGSSTFFLNVSAQEGDHKNSFRDRGTISPPGSTGIVHLKDRCIGCQLCISVCPSKVLQPSFLEYGFTGMMLPRMDNKSGFCNYECTKCGEVCPTGAILPLNKEEKKLTQIGVVHFAKRHCIVESEGTACGSCSEHCPTQAVYMIPYKDNLTIPETNPDICIGCGACEYACPVTEPHAAIFVLANKEHRKAQKPVSNKIEVETTEDFPF